MASIVAVLDVSAPDYGGLDGAGVSLAGRPIDGPDAIPVELSEPLDIVIPLDAAPAAEWVELAVSARRQRLGPPLGDSREVDPESRPDGRLGQVTVSSARLLLGGKGTAELRLKREGAVAAIHQVAVDPAQSPLLTVPGVLLVVLLITVIAHAESLTRGLRARGRSLAARAGLVAVAQWPACSPKPPCGCWLAARNPRPHACAGALAGALFGGWASRKARPRVGRAA